MPFFICLKIATQKPLSNFPPYIVGDNLISGQRGIFLAYLIELVINYGLVKMMNDCLSLKTRKNSCSQKISLILSYGSAIICLYTYSSFSGSSFLCFCYLKTLYKPVRMFFLLGHWTDLNKLQTWLPETENIAVLIPFINTLPSPRFGCGSFSEPCKNV